MFFAISPKSLPNFPNNQKFGAYYINTDNGWHLREDNNRMVLWKGYCDQGSLSDLIENIHQQPEPVYTGNFCVLIFEKITHRLLVRNDRYRGFPLYAAADQLTNLTKQDYTVWSDSIVDLDENFNLHEKKFDLIGHIDETPVSESQVMDFIIERLDQRTENFLQNNKLPIKVFVSGGVDSMLVFSFLKKHTDDFQFIKSWHIDFDDFWLNNLDKITQYWGYQQIHHWNDPCILTSGAPGDEFFLRSPITAGMFCKYFGKNILDELQSNRWKDCSHRTYFLKEKNAESLKNLSIDPNQSKKSFFWELCNININDWQHWHIGETLTWTPLKDLEIFKMFLRLPIDTALGQIMNSSISRNIIEHNCKGLSENLASQKNSMAYMSNLKGLYRQYS